MNDAVEKHDLDLVLLVNHIYTDINILEDELRYLREYINDSYNEKHYNSVMFMGRSQQSVEERLTGHLKGIVSKLDRYEHMKIIKRNKLQKANETG